MYFVFLVRHSVVELHVDISDGNVFCTRLVHGQTALHFSLFVLAFAFELAEVEIHYCVVKRPKNVIPERGLVL